MLKKRNYILNGDTINCDVILLRDFLSTENSRQFSLVVSFCSVRNHKPKVKMHKIDYTAVIKKNSKSKRQYNA